MSRVVEQLKRQERTPPLVVSRAQQRPKLVELSDRTITRAADGPTEQLLRAIADGIERATFTNNADRNTVKQMIFRLEWTMREAVEKVLARRGGIDIAALTEEPKPAGWTQKLRTAIQVTKLSTVWGAHITAAHSRDRATSDGVELLAEIHPEIDASGEAPSECPPARSDGRTW